LNQQYIKRVIAGLVPATPINVALPCRTTEVAGTSPATTRGDVIQTRP
jgi:hypothetical protein